MDICKRVNEIDGSITKECIGNLYMAELEADSTSMVQYYAWLAIAAAIQEQTEVLKELKNKISDIVQYTDDIYGREFGALTITGGLNTYEQN